MDSTRNMISAGKHITRLEKFIRGDIEMTTGQLSAAKILLDRTVPVLSATEVTQGDYVPEIGPLEAERMFQEALREHLAKASDAEIADLMGKPKLELVNDKTG